MTQAGKKKEDKKKEQDELNMLFRPVQTVGKGKHPIKVKLILYIDVIIQSKWDLYCTLRWTLSSNQNEVYTELWGKHPIKTNGHFAQDM